MTTNDDVVIWYSKLIASKVSNQGDRSEGEHINVFQMHLFLHQLTQNMTKDCSIGHLICTLISENQGLEKLRSVSNLIKNIE